MQPPSLYAAMTGADMDHPLVVITVGRCECCAPWSTLCCMYSLSAFNEMGAIEAAQLHGEFTGKAALPFLEAIFIGSIA